MFGTTKLIPGVKADNDVVRQVIIVLAVLTLISLIGINFFDLSIIAIIDAVILLFLFCLRFPRPAFYLTVAVYPFFGWQFVYGAINVPLMDILALFIFAAWLITVLLNWRQRALTRADFPGLLFAVLFFASGALSLINAEEVGLAIKYLARPMIFFYLMYVVLPYNLIRDKKQLITVFKIMAAVGAAVALLGMLSLIYTPGPWYVKRAVPYTLWGIDFLGGNQNAVAEVLTVALPVTLILYALAKQPRHQAYLALGLIVMTLVMLFTFSRSGWLALLLELLILFVLRYRKKVDWKLAAPALAVMASLLAILYFSVWQNIAWVRASNTSRLLMSEIAWTHFLDQPLIGNGVNSFMPIMGETFAFIVEFGSPLESHGFVQKIITEQGVLGLIAFSGLLLVIFRIYYLALKKQHNDKDRFVLEGLFMMLSGIVLFELFSTSYYVSSTWLPIGIGLAATRIYGGARD